MLIPDTLFFYIMNTRQISALPVIDMNFVRGKRWWKNKTEEEKENFKKMRSKVQKKVFKTHPEIKKNFHKGTSRAKQEFWDNVDPEWKEKHIDKMSTGMKKAWNEDNDDFGPRIANAENVKLLNGNIIIEKDVPRINDYSGVITNSEMAQL